LERHILETIGFDFMGQYPQKLLVKMVGKLFCPGRDATDQKTKLFLRTSYDMSIDLYKTFAPIKQTNAALVLAVLELTALLLGDGVEEVRAINPRSLYTERGCVYETMLDLLDLYHQFSKSTKIGPRFDINKLMGVKIDINNRMSEEDFARYEGWCDECDTTEVHPVTPGSAKSPATNHSASGSSSVRRKGTFSEGTQRFVFDAEEARKEKSLVSRYFDEEFEEYEVEVEEPIREPEPRHPSNARNNFPHRGNSHGHNDRNGGPYSRGGRQNNYSDRSRGRKGPGY
jgi:CTD kinase subunit beta